MRKFGLSKFEFVQSRLQMRGFGHRLGAFLSRLALQCSANQRRNSVGLTNAARRVTLRLAGNSRHNLRQLACLIDPD